jgi:hypothetical protein
MQTGAGYLLDTCFADSPPQAAQSDAAQDG